MSHNRIKLRVNLTYYIGIRFRDCVASPRINLNIIVIFSMARFSLASLSYTQYGNIYNLWAILLRKHPILIQPQV